MATRTSSALSDPALLGEIRQYGKFDSAACYQCGTCTIACDLVTNSASFPRKTIRYALLGLRAPLLGSLDPWICHDCGDCSVMCPRQSEPRISMATLRRFLCAHYDWTGVSSRLMRSRAWYLGSLACVAFLVLLLILSYHLWYVGLSVGQLNMPMGLEHMFPTIMYYTLTVIFAPFLLLLSRLVRVRRLAIPKEQRAGIPLSIYVSEAWTYVYQSVTHTLMRACPERGRWFGHWALALGTVTMLTIKAFALRWFQTDKVYSFYNPQRWIGYVAAGLILYGVCDVLKHRFRGPKRTQEETRVEDLSLPLLLLLTALSGLSVHIFRYAGWALCAHFAYAAHVVIATPMLLVEMAFGKWAHMIYRPLALYFQAVKDRAEQQQQAPAQEGVGYAI